MGALDSILIPSLRLEEILSDGSTLTNPAADSRRLFLGEDGYLHLRDSAGNITDPVAPGSGDVATDAIWDAAGDLAVGSGANTAARLAIGAAGGHVARVNGAVAWNSGTSFPTAATGDRYWRTDLGLEAYYDGTRWLTTTLYRETMGHSTTAMPLVSSSGSVTRMTPWHTTYDLWLDAFYSSTYVGATNDGSNYWTVLLQKANAADAKTTIVSFTTAADTQANWTTRRTAIGALLVPGTYKEMDVQATETGTVGDLYWALAVAYRLVLT